MKQPETKSKERLQAEVGNLEVQISEYRQIVQELTKKLEAYENKYGRVFKPSRNISVQK
tara:strand:- start:100 stop:276 length:177 start_codon:yes stop_codon:yes gene_type:complete